MGLLFGFLVRYRVVSCLVKDDRGFKRRDRDFTVTLRHGIREHPEHFTSGRKGAPLTNPKTTRQEARKLKETKPPSTKQSVPGTETRGKKKGREEREKREEERKEKNEEKNELTNHISCEKRLALSCSHLQHPITPPQTNHRHPWKIQSKTVSNNIP